MGPPGPGAPGPPPRHRRLRHRATSEQERPEAQSAAGLASEAPMRTAAVRRRSRSAGCSGPGSCCRSCRAGASACATARPTLARAVARPAARLVPVRRLGQVAAPCQQHGPTGCRELHDEIGGAVAVRRAGVNRAADRGDRPAPDRQPAGCGGVRSAPRTVSPLAVYESDGNAKLEEAGSFGHMLEIAPPAPEHCLPLAFVMFHVARKS